MYLKVMDFDEFLIEAVQMEDICLQMRDMRIGPDDKEIAKVKTPGRRIDRPNRYSGNNHRTFQDQR